MVLLLISIGLVLLISAAVIAFALKKMPGISGLLGIIFVWGG